MKTIAETIKEMEKAKERREYSRNLLASRITNYGFIESNIWIAGHNMRDFDLFNGYLPDQIYKVIQNSFPYSFTFYAYYSPTENAFFDVNYYENSKWIDVDGFVAMPVFINYKKI